MPRNLLIILFLLFFSRPLFAQHADLGSGVLKNHIWWINWAGVTITNGATKTYTTNDGLSIPNATGREPYPACHLPSQHHL